MIDGPTSWPGSSCSRTARRCPTPAARSTYAAEFFRWFSEEAVRPTGDLQIAPAGANRILVVRQPDRRRAAGHAVELPGGHGHPQDRPGAGRGMHGRAQAGGRDPLTALALAALLDEAGVPAGVVNVVPSPSRRRRRRARCSHDPGVRKLSFTGSTEVGRTLLAAGGRPRGQLLDGARRQRTVRGLRRRRPRRGGRRRDDRQDAQRRRGLHGGQPLLSSRGIARRSPGVSAARWPTSASARASDGVAARAPDQRRAAKIGGRSMARSRPARRSRTGGQPPDGPEGFFYPPTVLDRRAADAEILGEEIFGPVAPIIAFDDRGRGGRAGQRHRVRAGLLRLHRRPGPRARVGRRLEAGMVGLNRGLVSDPAAPFGGVKQSGLGREGGHDGPARVPREPSTSRSTGRSLPTGSQAPKTSGCAASSLRVRRMCPTRYLSASTGSRRWSASMRRLCSALTIQRRPGSAHEHERPAVVLGRVPQLGDRAEEMVLGAGAVGGQVELTVEGQELAHVDVLLDSALDVRDRIEVGVQSSGRPSISASGSIRSRIWYSVSTSSMSRSGTRAPLFGSTVMSPSAARTSSASRTGSRRSPGARRPPPGGCASRVRARLRGFARAGPPPRARWPPSPRGRAPSRERAPGGAGTPCRSDSTRARTACPTAKGSRPTAAPRVGACSRSAPRAPDALIAQVGDSGVHVVDVDRDMMAADVAVARRLGALCLGGLYSKTSRIAGRRGGRTGSRGSSRARRRSSARPSRCRRRPGRDRGGRGTRSRGRPRGKPAPRRCPGP